MEAQKTKQDGAAREKRKFWVITEGQVVEAEGLRCNPSANLWWFPSVGYTLTVGHHAFSSQVKALEKALSDATAMCRLWMDRRAALTKELDAAVKKGAK